MSAIDSYRPKRRDRLFIIAEILEIAQEGALKTQIMYRGNLSFTQLNEYLNFLTERRLLKIIEEDGKKLYTTTRRGIKYLKNYREIKSLLTRSENDKILVVKGNTTFVRNS